MIQPGRRILAVGGSPRAHAGGLVLLGLFAVVFVVVASVVVRGMLDFGGGSSSAFGAFFGVVFGLAVVGLVLGAVSAARAAAWVEGSVLTVRRLSTRSVDVAAAGRAWIDSRREASGYTSVTTGDGSGAAGWMQVPTGYRSVPRLNVVGADGRVLTLRLLSGRGVLLAAEDLRVLADVVDRCPAAEARETAQWLRGQAADPDRFYR